MMTGQAWEVLPTLQEYTFGATIETYFQLLLGQWRKRVLVIGGPESLCRSAQVYGAGSIVAIGASTPYEPQRDGGENPITASPRWGPLTFVNGDARRLPDDLGEHHLTVMCDGIGLAQSRVELNRIARSFARTLIPQRGMGLILCLEPGKVHTGYDRYGITIAGVEREGARSLIIFTDLETKLSATFPYTYWSRTSIQDAFTQAGCILYLQQTVPVSPAGIKRYGRDFWESYINDPPLTLLGFFRNETERTA